MDYLLDIRVMPGEWAWELVDNIVKPSGEVLMWAIEEYLRIKGRN